MLKNLNRLFLVILVLSFLSCKKKENQILTPISNNGIYIDTINNSTSINDLYKTAKNEIDFPYSNIIILNSRYNYKQYNIDKNINNVLFFRDSINSISFSNNKINNLTLENCHINNLLITSSKVNNLNIKNCKINYLEIISSPFNLINISTAQKDTVNKVLIKNCEKSKGVFFDGNFNEITIDGGEIYELDITKIKSRKTELKIMGTRLFYPNFYNNLSNNVDVFMNSTITASSFNTNSILIEDRELSEISSFSSYNTNRVEIFNRFRFVEQSYGILSNKLIRNNDKQLSNYFSYRQSKTHNTLNQTYFLNKLSVLWNEYFRGNYGTSISPIIFTFLTSWILFTILYLFLSYINFIFFFYKITDHEGKTNEKSYFITYDRKTMNFYFFFKHCVWFSLSQMVAGSIISSLNFGRFTTLYLTPPRKYFTIGFGVFFSIIQNIIGIILVFNFITTFINISLK